MLLLSFSSVNLSSRFLPVRHELELHGLHPLLKRAPIRVEPRDLCWESVRDLCRGCLQLLEVLLLSFSSVNLSSRFLPVRHELELHGLHPLLKRAPIRVELIPVESLLTHDPLAHHVANVNQTRDDGEMSVRRGGALGDHQLTWTLSSQGKKLVTRYVLGFSKADASLLLAAAELRIRSRATGDPKDEPRALCVLLDSNVREASRAHPHSNRVGFPIGCRLAPLLSTLPIEPESVPCTHCAVCGRRRLSPIG